MRDYELSLIIHPRVDESDVTNVVDTVSQMIKAGEGQVASVNVWGRRRLMYAIKKQTDGTYVIVNAQLQPSALPELERSLKLNEDVLRYMIIRRDE